MIVLVFVLSYVLLLGLRRLMSRVQASPPQTASHPDRVQDRWTALDEFQLTRLLEDNAPC